MTTLDDPSFALARTDSFLGDIQGQEGGYTVQLINGGTLDVTNPLGHHVGITVCQANTAAASGVCIQTSAGSVFALGGSRHKHIFLTPIAFTSGGGNRLLRSGLQRNIGETADPARGIWGQYVGSGVFSGKCANGTSTSTTATTFTLSSSTWYRFEIEISEDRATVTFRLYESDTQTIVWTDTLTTNIPGLTSTDVFAAGAYFGTDAATALAGVGQNDYLSFCKEGLVR